MSEEDKDVGAEGGTVRDMRDTDIVVTVLPPDLTIFSRDKGSGDVRKDRGVREDDGDRDTGEPGTDDGGTESD